MSGSSVEDGDFMGTPETVQDHELFTSGSESSLGDGDAFLSKTSMAQQQAEMVIQQHETRKSPESNESPNNE